jgi:hypothetical protein
VVTDRVHQEVIRFIEDNARMISDEFYVPYLPIYHDLVFMVLVVGLDMPRAIAVVCGKAPWARPVQSVLN